MHRQAGPEYAACKRERGSNDRRKAAFVGPLFVPEITLLNFKSDLARKVFLAAGSASIIM